MSDVKSSDAFRVLRREFGFRLDESRERGRERMVGAVEMGLGVARQVAEDAVYALEHAEVVRYVRGDSGEAGVPMPQGLPGGATAPAPIIPRSPTGTEDPAGHWRIGEGG